MPNNDYRSARQVAWNMFTATGDPSYYALYVSLKEAEERMK